MIFKSKKRIVEYWKRMMESAQRKMSVGAQRISRGIPWPRKDSWRRQDKVQRGRDHTNKHS